MPSDRVSRHLAQKKNLKNMREQRNVSEASHVAPIMTNASIENGGNVDIMEKFVRLQQQEFDAIRTPIVSSQQEIDSLLSEMKSRWNRQKVDLLLGSCRGSVISSIVGPFGLGSVVAAMDKTGGNVTTVHNAKQNIYARREDRYNREHYAGKAYNRARDQYKDEKIIENSQLIQDEYTGEYSDYSQVDCDHIKPTKRYHQEGGFMQSEETRERFGSDANNFAMTSSNGNRSLGASDKKSWQAKEATDNSGRSNKEVHKHDNRRVNPALKRGDETADKYKPSTVEKATYYGKRAAITGASEAGKMGFQQSLGLLLTEFFSSVFDEIIDSYSNGFKDSLNDQSFFEALRERFERIARRVAARWKDAVVAFKDGAISAFLSNMVTMLINLVITTGTRIVRVIREGFFSILKALKILLFPADGMTNAESADAALKLLTGGVVVTLGIMAEEVVEKCITAFFSHSAPFLSPYASLVSVVIVGALTGISSAILVYGLDKLDVFGVQEDREHEAILNELDVLILETNGNIEKIYQDEMSRFELMRLQLSGN